MGKRAEKSLQCLEVLVPYRMAGNFGRELILADWQFLEQSANISPPKNSQCDVIIIVKS